MLVLRHIFFEKEEQFDSNVREHCQKLRIFVEQHRVLTVEMYENLFHFLTIRFT